MEHFQLTEFMFLKFFKIKTIKNVDFAIIFYMFFSWIFCVTDKCPYRVRLQEPSGCVFSLIFFLS